MPESPLQTSFKTPPSTAPAIASATLFSPMTPMNDGEPTPAHVGKVTFPGRYRDRCSEIAGVVHLETTGDCAGFAFAAFDDAPLRRNNKPPATQFPTSDRVVRMRVLTFRPALKKIAKAGLRSTPCPLRTPPAAAPLAERQTEAVHRCPRWATSAASASTRRRSAARSPAWRATPRAIRAGGAWRFGERHAPRAAPPSARGRRGEYPKPGPHREPIAIHDDALGGQ